MASKRVINLDEASAPASNMSMLVDDPTYGARKLPLSKMLAADGDSKSNTVQYSTGDAADSEVTKDTGWTTVAPLASGATHKTLLEHISTMFKNIRWLYKKLGDTDISSISTAGTVTGALAKLNTDLTGTSDCAQDIFAWASSVKGFGIIRTQTNTTVNLPDVSDKYGLALAETYQGGSNVWIRLIWFPTSGARVYITAKRNTDPWEAWALVPTRSEVDTLYIKFKMVTIESVTIASNGYASIGSYRPTDMRRFLFAMMNSWSSTASALAGALSITDNGYYLLGPPGTTVNGLIVTYYYTD